MGEQGEKSNKLSPPTTSFRPSRAPSPLSHTHNHTHNHTTSNGLLTVPASPTQQPIDHQNEELSKVDSSQTYGFVLPLFVRSLQSQQGGMIVPQVGVGGEEEGEGEDEEDDEYWEEDEMLEEAEEEEEGEGEKDHFFHFLPSFLPKYRVASILPSEDKNADELVDELEKSSKKAMGIASYVPRV